MKNNFIRKCIFHVRDYLLPRHEGKDSNEEISRRIEKGEPFMLARFGAVEIKAILYGILPPPFRWLIKPYIYTNMPRNAGFFPATKEAFGRFSDLMIQDMLLVDILASWRPEEIFFRKRLRRCFKIGLGDLNPHTENADFWLQALKGKRVLVVHPFSQTIGIQYKERRTKLFPKEDFLPEFLSLETVKAVQTIAGNHKGFESWFDALIYMEKEIEKHDFDVALLGCGAYGFPLAAHVKRMGKQSIHLGGVLQLYFGIKGKRWDNWGIYNEYWTSPSKTEKPKGADSIEGGCYW